ncbi:MAG TPA: hypothetical protein VFN67_33080 [Polyangiales bacterium]|nr:hypothetical protein [Polyangiales bacterium]
MFDRSSTSRAPRISQLCLVLTVAGLFGLTSGTSLAFAQAGQNDDGLPSAILLATHVQRGKPVAELDKQIRNAVVEHAPVHLLDGPAKKLSALQAGARCRDESVACLRNVAKLAGVEVLLGATLERGAGELTLSFMAFDARADAVTRVAHWQDGSDVTAETYAALPNLLAALFPEPGPPDMDFVAEANAGGTFDPTARPLDAVTSGNPSPPQRSLLGPILVASGGALLLGAGVVTGVMLKSTQDDYSDKEVHTRADAERADALRSRASTEASLANVFYGLGSVALVASSAWLAIELWGSGNKQEHASTTTLAPWIAPRQLGLVLRHEGGVF